MCGINLNDDTTTLLASLCEQVEGLAGIPLTMKMEYIHKTIRPSDVQVYEHDQQFLDYTPVGLRVMFHYTYSFNGHDYPGLLCHFTITQLPGNDQIYISSGQYVSDLHRGCGIGTLMTEFKARLVRHFGGYMLIATVNNFNEPEIHILQKLGWHEVASASSIHVGTPTHIWTKLL